MSRLQPWSVWDVLGLCVGVDLKTSVGDTSVPENNAALFFEKKLSFLGRACCNAFNLILFHYVKMLVRQ